MTLTCEKCGDHCQMIGAHRYKCDTCGETSTGRAVEKCLFVGGPKHGEKMIVPSNNSQIKIPCGWKEACGNTIEFIYTPVIRSNGIKTYEYLGEVLSIPYQYKNES